MNHRKRNNDEEVSESLSEEISERLRQREVIRSQREEAKSLLWGTEPLLPSTPEANASILQQLYYGWVTPYIGRVSKGLCTDADLPPPLPEHAAHPIGKALSEQLDEDIEKSRGWEPYLGCRVRYKKEPETLGYLRWIGYMRQSDYSHDLLVGVEWSVAPRKRREALAAGKDLALHDGVVHGECLFRPLFHNRRACSCEVPKHIELEPPRGFLPPPPPAAPDILWSLFKSHKKHILMQVPSKLLSDLTSVSLPVALEYYVAYISSENITWTAGIGLVICIFLLSAVHSCCEHKYEHISIRAASIFENASVAVIMEKCLKISGRYLLLPEMSLGKVVNMITSDVRSVADLNYYLAYFWSAPLQLLLCLILLYRLVGWCALCGVAVLLLTFPIQGMLTKKDQDIREKLAVVVDARIRRTNELLSASRIVKFMGWENRFIKVIDDIREQELALTWKRYWYDLYFITVDSATPIIVIAVVLVSYYLSGHELTPEIVFPTIALLNTLRIPFFMIPVIVSAILQCFVSTRRLTGFLESEDGESKVGDVKQLYTSGAHAAMTEADVQTYMPVALPSCESCSTGIFSRLLLLFRPRKMAELEWRAEAPHPNKEKLEPRPDQPDKSKKKDTQENASKGKGDEKESEAKKSKEGGDDSSNLHQLLPKVLLSDVNILIPDGELTIVVGETGCGKSSLLLSLIGTYDTQRGEVWSTKSIAYVPQQPWIMNATVRENILFFSEERDAALQEAIRVSQLEADLKLMADGLETEIGEKGINLSGGQKARVSLARAVYADREMYLLDDPLSALDAHVGEKVIRECILGKLAGKTRVLATHHLHVLRHADHVIALGEHRVLYSGSREGFLKSDAYRELHPNARSSSEDDHDAENESNSASGGVGGRGGESVTEEGTEKREEEDGPDKGKAGHLMSEEEKATGSVAGLTYRAYAQACGGMWIVALIIVMYALTELSIQSGPLWLSMWSAKQLDLPDHVYLAVYLAFVLVSTSSSPLRFWNLYTAMRRGSVHIHRNLLVSIASGTMEFFDTTPLGRIMNRFSRDVDVADNNLPMSLQSVLNSAFGIFASITITVVSQPVVLVALIPCSVVYYRIMVFYNAANREIRRLSSLLKSPVYAMLSEVLNGTSTITAYSAGKSIMEATLSRVDLVFACGLVENASNRWVGVRIEFLSIMIVAASTIAAVCITITKLVDGDVTLISLAITMALQTSGLLNWLVRQIATLEADMNSIERVFYYTSDIAHEEMPGLLEEAAEYIAQKKAALASDAVAIIGDEKRGVVAGAIEFREVQMRYREGLPLVLKNVSFRIAPREKVGVVGRTGSGKSTLLLTFLRMVDICGGEILVNGTGIRAYGLRELRKQFSMIPQDPVLFDGTVRQNLDPFLESSVEEVWEAVTLCGLRERLESETGGLEGHVLEGGANFSVGQRQLLCMARALLRKGSGFILMDEATANIDPALDQHIQRTVMSAFGEYTVITIAHRLHTVAKYDKIIVMDQGMVAEMGTPRELVMNRQSVLRSMVESMGVGGVEEFTRLLE